MKLKVLIVLLVVVAGADAFAATYHVDAGHPQADDNGNGSAGTFYEGAMTAGHPGDGVADKVQANIVAAKYDVARLTQTRLTSFTPNAVKEVTASFTNTNAAAMENVRLTVSLPAGWTARASGPATFASVAPGVSVRRATSGSPCWRGPGR